MLLTNICELNMSLSGMSILHKNNETPSRFILVNSNHSLARQHFTICHELFHLFVQKDFKTMLCVTGLFDKSKDKNEYLADLFASDLLMPKEAIISIIPENELHSSGISLATILKLEQYFSSSRRAILYRLKNLDIIKQNIVDKYKDNVLRSAMEYGYDLNLYNKGNENKILGDYGTLAKTLFDKHLITEAHYYNLMDEMGIDVNFLAETDEETT